MGMCDGVSCYSGHLQTLHGVDEFVADVSIAELVGICL